MTNVLADLFGPFPCPNCGNALEIEPGGHVVAEQRGDVLHLDAAVRARLCRHCPIPFTIVKVNKETP